ncbi:CBS domain-containing protein [Paraburkholderia sp. Tr-20389]|uniref:CBS domain-containing protein n=1 Tax=Paraburkholderia sp. Tr-20389 TaxID=2703903 RepID=UPI001980C5F0|nr:CBS domain-containing protein [Paraburkholderia sp. Tr-20389]MBN3756662.1 CBS domain-containing protein [Paraburkholderia sp. Tr-20389]
MSISSVLQWCFGAQPHHVGPDHGHSESNDGPDDDAPRSPAPHDERRAVLGELHRQAYLHELLRLTCADVMRTPPVTVSVDETIGSALKTLDAHHIKLLPVVDAQGRLKGVVTHVDLQPLDEVLPFLKLASDTTAPESERREWPVTTVMSAHVQYVDLLTPLTEVIPLFTRNGHHHLPVVEEGGRVVGMLTQADILKLMCGRPGGF